MEQEESYRDKIATIGDDGKRIWIFPKMPKGKFYNKRKIFSYFLLIMLFAGPHLRIGGEPLLLMNILDRKFVIFGQIFWPQDMYLFALSMLVLILFIILFTIVFGRLFCGWACPQTIFMEMVFRRIEYWIEGDWKQQQRLKKMPWNKEKILKKGAKNTLFWIISFLIANTFLAYIIGSEELWIIATDGIGKHTGGLIAISVFTTIFYAVFTFFREQVCTVVCPYGRLQDVLLDQKSLLVIYDNVRGEGRGKFRKGEDRPTAEKGDCIDCHQCVNVCPTGIDIRNGTQLECINCTACIDVCNSMMDGIGLEQGLIRYDSMEGVKNKTPFKITNRVKAYSVVLALLLTLLTVLLVNRSDFEASILRTRGTLFQEMEDGRYSNIYDISLINKTNEEIPVEVRIIEGLGEITLIGNDMLIDAQGEFNGKFLIIIDEKDFTSSKMEIIIGIYKDGELIDTAKTKFIAPML